MGAASRFELDFALAFAGTRNLFQHFFYFRAELLEHIVIFPKNLYRDIGANALQHFVETHFDRLCDHDVGPRIESFDFLADDFGELIFGDQAIVDLSPFFARFVVDVKVGIARRHRVGGDLRAADSRKDMRDLRDTLGDFSLRLPLLFDALVDIDAARPKNHHGESTFIELRNEIRPEMAKDEYRQCE